MGFDPENSPPWACSRHAGRMQDLVSLPSAPFALPIVHLEREEMTTDTLRLIVLSLVTSANWCRCVLMTGTRHSGVCWQRLPS